MRCYSGEAGTIWVADDGRKLMANNMFQSSVNGRMRLWTVSARGAGDWYVISYGGAVVADHLPSRQAAIEAGRAYYESTAHREDVCTTRKA